MRSSFKSRLRDGPIGPLLLPVRDRLRSIHERYRRGLGRAAPSTRHPALSFLPRDEQFFHSWDKEWCYYLSTYHGHDWFKDLSQTSDDVRRFQAEFDAASGRQAVFDSHVMGPGCKLQLWNHRDDLKDKMVAELGCGPAKLGKTLGHVVKHYIGIDASRLAIQIASLVTPPNCRLIHLGQQRLIAEFEGTRDTVVTRHFYIHQPFASALWSAKLAHFLLKRGGLFVADYYDPSSEKIDEGQYLPAKSAFDPHGPSHLFLFSDEERQEVAAKAGFTIEEVYHNKDEEKCFVRMRK